MSPGTPTEARRSGFPLGSWRIWLGASFTLLFIGLFLYRVDLSRMAGALADAAYLLLIPAVGFYFLGVGFRTVRWARLLSPLGRVGFGVLFPVVVVGYMANNLLPVRLGEVVRAYYLGQKTGLSKMSGLGSIAVERVFDGLTLLLLALVGALFFPVLGLLRGFEEDLGIPWLAMALAVTVPFLLGIGAFALLAAHPALVGRLVRVITAWLPERWRARAGEVAQLFVEGLGALRSRRQVAVVVLLSALVWLSETGLYVLVGLAFGLEEALGTLPQLLGGALLVAAVSNLATAIPSSQGGIGPFEFFAKQTLVLVGVAAELASAYALVLHATLLVPVTVVGLGYLWRENLSLRQLTREERESGAVGYGAGPVPAEADDGA